jgi:hypothetical protein
MYTAVKMHCLKEKRLYFTLLGPLCSAYFSCFFKLKLKLELSCDQRVSQPVYRGVGLTSGTRTIDSGR